MSSFSHPEEAAIANKTEIGLTEVEEGEEPEVFWIALGGKEDYGSLLNGKLVRMRFQVNNKKNKWNIFRAYKRNIWLLSQSVFTCSNLTIANAVWYLYC